MAQSAYTAKSYLHKEQTTPVLTKYRMHNNLALYDASGIQEA
jgi:hypothetical protein